MALKDWKKAYDINNHIKWFNKKDDGHEVEVKYWIASDLWKFSYNDWSSFREITGGKLVDTKSEALKLAKQYMRSH